MEIQDIKQSLTLATILHHYGIKPNKNNMLLCPFHEDTKPSLQINLETNFYKCHACGKKGDQIQWVQDFGKLTKREAILKCVTMIDGVIINVPSIVKQETTTITEDKSIFLEKMFQSFRKGIFNSPPAKQYSQQRNLNIEVLQIGFNGGQFHHGTRRDETLINNCLAVGLLLDRNIISKTGTKAFNVFGNKSIVFPLKNKENHIVSLYFRSTINEKEAKHFYLKNRAGLYPNYPNPATKKLILTESIIDCASLLQITEIAENYSLLACYGTNGLNEEIQKAVLELTELEEIIFAFDNDEAGNEAVKKYAAQFKQYKISTIELPNKDINETLQLHENEIIIELLNQRKELNFLFSIEDKTRTKPTTNIDFLKQNNLLQELNVLIEKSGIIGEENSRLLLFIIASSYKTKSPLHAIVQGSSGSGKTHLISKIADLIPPEDVLRFTRITESQFVQLGRI